MTRSRTRKFCESSSNFIAQFSVPSFQFSEVSQTLKTENSKLKSVLPFSPQLNNAASRDAAAKGELATLARPLAEDQVEQVQENRPGHSRPDELERCLFDKTEI
jgi:hypothetical protein